MRAKGSARPPRGRETAGRQRREPGNSRKGTAAADSHASSKTAGQLRAAFGKAAWQSSQNGSRPLKNI
jgi:hypothetical protein